jgi:hypothetical protein
MLTNLTAYQLLAIVFIGACVVIGLIMYLSKKKKVEDLE